MLPPNLPQGPGHPTSTTAHHRPSRCLGSDSRVSPPLPGQGCPCMSPVPWQVTHTCPPCPVLEPGMSLQPAGVEKLQDQPPSSAHASTQWVTSLCPEAERCQGAAAVPRWGPAASAPSCLPRSGSPTEGPNGDARPSRSWRLEVQVTTRGWRGWDKGPDARGGDWGAGTTPGGHVAEICH